MKSPEKKQSVYLILGHPTIIVSTPFNTMLGATAYLYGRGGGTPKVGLLSVFVFFFTTKHGGFEREQQNYD